MENKQVISSPDVNVSAMEEVFDNMYITNVEKRLRELNAPSEIDKKRWIWELIQNAKDTIALDSSRNEINIRIDITGDVVKFRHDGAPFTAKARYGLLYKYSGGKENQESTGRFGTGFLTTHCLSKIVTIESNQYSNKDCTELCGFEVTMYRDGLVASELIEGLKKMRASEKFYKQTFEWTTFTYHINSDSGRDAVRLGVQNFHENIAQTMLFCKELKSIELNDNGCVTKINRLLQTSVDDNIILAEYEIENPHHSYKRRFLFSNYECPSKELSERYRAERTIRLDVAIEIDKNNNLINHAGKTSHYCVLPLVGIEDQLCEPIIVNSPDFEPDSERQSLILSGQNWNDEKNVITETGINQLIYAQVFPLYENLVKFLSENTYGRLYYLASGLDKAKAHKNLDKEWYVPNVIHKYRDVLLKYEVVKAYNSSVYKKLSDCIIVKERTIENEDIVYSLLASLYPDKLVAENHEWSLQLWRSDINLWATEELCTDIENKQNWSNLVLVTETLTSWYNKFLKYISEFDIRLLSEHALLPNLNGRLLKKDTDGFQQGQNISDFVIELLYKLGKDVKPILLHSDISAVSLDSKYNSQSYSADINKLVKSIIESKQNPQILQRLLPLVSIVPDDQEKYNSEFLKTRASLFTICKDLYQLNITIECNNNLLEGAWKETDEWLVGYILSSLKDLGHLDKLPLGLDAKWLNSTLKSLNVQTSKLNTYAVLPNQYGAFCYQKDLFEDLGVPEELKDTIFALVGIDYKKILLHADVEASVFAINQNKTISTFANELHNALIAQTHSSWGNFFNGYYHKFSKEVIYKVSSYMIRLLPSNKESDLFKYQSSLLVLAQSFIKAEEVIAYLDFDNETLWNRISFYVTCGIWETIEKYSTLTELCQLLNRGELEVIQLLNNYYAYQDYAKINFDSDKVIPNQNGYLLSKKDLYEEDSVISDTLKNIINKLSTIDDGVQDYRTLLLDKRINLKLGRTLTEKDAYVLIDQSIAELYQNPVKWEKEDYIVASQMLIEEWGDKHKGLFEEYFPRVFPNKEKILMNVVWKKEKRELMMSVSSQLSEEQLKIIIENSSDISGLSSKVKELEDENTLLKNKLAELGLSISNGENNATIGVSLTTNEVNTPEQVTENNEAKKLVLVKLASEGFDVTNISSDYSVVQGVSRNGVNYPLVVKSCKNINHRIWINPNEWRQLFKPNSMLWLHFGDGLVAPIKAYELFTYQDVLTLSFDTANLMMDKRVDKIMQVLRYFNHVHLNLATLNPNTERANHLDEYLFHSNNASNSDLGEDNDLEF